MSQFKPLSGRRDFLKFIGTTPMASGLLSLTALTSCTQKRKKPDLTGLSFKPIKPSSKDEVVLAKGFRSQLLISWQEKINRKEEFGFNNDYTAFIAFPKNPNKAILWVNHESSDPIFIHGQYKKNNTKTLKEVRQEQRAVGGSLIEINKKTNGQWVFNKSSKYNRRINGLTSIPFSGHYKIKGKRKSIGTISNCAGGVTPWGTVLTCEENYHHYFGDNIYDKKGHKQFKPGKEILRWHHKIDNPTEHYGWVVEVNPWTGKAKKLIELGRCAHECATTRLAQDQRCVVYTADDQKFEHLYKFISHKPGRLDSGDLFVADTINGRWLSLNYEKNKKLQKRFESKTEMYIRIREAAKIVGATPLDRPEDIEIHPFTGDVYVTLTNNIKNNNKHGSILKISEKNNDPLSLNFTASTFLAGGFDAGFSAPDNLVFDKKGNLWMATDISKKYIGKGSWSSFKNNGLFFIPNSGPAAGLALQVASAPINAEFTGITFSKDYKTLFVSVQHPGEGTKDLTKPLSRWPTGKGLPKPSVITITGPALEALTTS